MKDKAVLCCYGLAKTPGCIPTSQLGQTPAGCVKLLGNNNRDGRVTTSLHLSITPDGNEVNTHVNNSPGMKLRF